MLTRVNGRPELEELTSTKVDCPGISKYVYFGDKRIGTIYNDGQGYKYAIMAIGEKTTGTTKKWTYKDAALWVANMAYRRGLLDTIPNH